MQKLISKSAMSIRGICFYCNSVLLAISDQFKRSIADMKQDLVDHRFDLCGFHQALNISDLEIGNTDRF